MRRPVPSGSESSLLDDPAKQQQCASNVAGVIHSLEQLGRPEEAFPTDLKI